MTKKIKYLLLDIRKYLLKTNLIYQKGKIFNNFIMIFFDLFVFFIGILFIIKGKLTLGSWFAFNKISTSFVGYLLSLLGSFQTLKQHSAIIERIEEITKIKEEDNNNSNLFITKGDICFNNICFGYQKDNIIFRSFSLNLKSNSLHCIFGRNGSGKATISKLLTRLYDISSGQIFIDGIDISKYNISHLRKNIVIMSQKIELFNDSIKYNIGLGLSRYPMNNLIKVSKLSNCYDFISKLPYNFDTIIGSDGVKLSIGQKQKIMMARVLIREPKILILDEPTSHLDLETKDKFGKILKKK